MLFLSEPVYGPRDRRHHLLNGFVAVWDKHRQCLMLKVTELEMLVMFSVYHQLYSPQLCFQVTLMVILTVYCLIFMKSMSEFRCVCADTELYGQVCCNYCSCLGSV